MNKPFTYEELRPALHKWAKFYHNRHFEYWELINAVWLAGKVQNVKSIKFASMRVKYGMIDYMRDQMDVRKKQRDAKAGRYTPTFTSMNVVVAEDTEYGELLQAPQQNHDSREYFDWLTCGLDRMDTLIIKLIYLEGFKQVEVAKVCGVREPTVSLRLTRLLPRIKEKLIRENPELAKRKYRKGGDPKVYRRHQDTERHRSYNRMYYQANKARIIEKRKEHKLISAR